MYVKHNFRKTIADIRWVAAIQIGIKADLNLGSAANIFSPAQPHR